MMSEAGGGKTLPFLVRGGEAFIGVLPELEVSHLTPAPPHARVGRAREVRPGGPLIFSPAGGNPSVSLRSTAPH